MTAIVGNVRQNEGVRIGYTLEQCWHRVPGGTGVSAIEVAKELRNIPDLDVIGVAGRHRHGPTKGYVPPVPMATLPFGRPLLYETWLRFNWPKVESVIADLDLVHATTIMAPGTSVPLVVTIHDLAFLRHPEFFTDRGNKMFRKSLNLLLTKADMVLCSSQATLNDCREAGFAESRLRHVPLGVTVHDITDKDRARVRATYELPSRFVLFVGTLEPRKNLPRLIEALASIPGAPPLLVAGMNGWGDQAITASHDVRFLDFVPAHNLPALYEACTVFAFPSILEGYGLPVIEAMAHGAAVVTSRGTSTEEVAGGAAELVDPLSVESIAQGLKNAFASGPELQEQGAARAAQLSWAHTAELTAQAYRDVLAGRS
jgi:glycosyltransferase involved in cell wall biosynthesis